MNEKTRNKCKKTLNILFNVVLYAFLAVCLCALAISMFSQKSDGAVTLFGKLQLRVVVSPSMERNDAVDVSQYQIKSIPVRSMVFVSVMPQEETAARRFYDDLQVGDVLTFKYVYSRQETITHRLVQKESNGKGGYFLYLKGDNAAEETESDVQVIDTDDEMGLNYVIGKVTGQSVVLGNIVYALQQPLGMALIVIVPCAIIAIGEVIKIGNIIAARKRERAEAENRRLSEESAAKETEIAELRRRLSELSQTSVANAAPANGAEPNSDSPADNNEPATNADGANDVGESDDNK